MTAAEKHIRHYNRLNGKTVSHKALAGFHTSLKKDIASRKIDQHVPFGVEAIGIEKRIKRVLDEGHEFYAVSLKPISLSGYKKPIANRKARKIAPVSQDMLHGVENIQQDSIVGCSSLDGISDSTYEVITNKILDLIKSDGLIWRMPWNDRAKGPSALAQNYVTKTVYRGVNFYLNYLRISEKYARPYYFTFNQVDTLGGKVKKGEKGWPVIYFKNLYKEIRSGKLVDEKKALDASGKLKKGYQKIPAVFYYLVWNIDQCEGLTVKPPKNTRSHDPIESAETIVNGMPKPPKIEFSGKDAFYMRSEDLVRVPERIYFKKVQQFYSTLFHELIHATSHPDRVFREREKTRRFGDEKYAFEELIAELGASFLCGESGILYFTLQNSAAYIKNWTTALVNTMKEDPRFFLRAASQAQKAADFILARGEFAKLKKKAPKKIKPVAVKKVKPKQRPPVKVRKPSPAPRKQKVAVRKPVSQKAESLSGIKIHRADQASEPRDLFTIGGNIGQWLQQQQRHKLAITITGEYGSGKSELAVQMIRGFIDSGLEVMLIDHEKGGLDSKDTMNALKRYMDKNQLSKLKVVGEVPSPKLENIKKLARSADVIVIDSGTKIMLNDNSWVEELREQFPKTIWVVLFQRNAKGRLRGGASAEYDAPVAIETFRPDWNDYTKNYAAFNKNRSNRLDLWYMIATGEVTNVEPSIRSAT